MEAIDGPLIFRVGYLYSFFFQLLFFSSSFTNPSIQSQTFTCFVFLDLTSAIQSRGLGCSLFQNKMLITTVSISFITQLALIYVGFMQKIFHTAPLGGGDLGIILGLAMGSFWVHEGRRWYERRLDRDEVWVGSIGELA